MARQGLKPDRETDGRPRASSCTQARRMRPATHVERRELGLGEREGLMCAHAQMRPPGAGRCYMRPRLARGVKVSYNTKDQNLLRVVYQMVIEVAGTQLRRPHLRIWIVLAVTLVPVLSHLDMPRQPFSTPNIAPDPPFYAVHEFYTGR